MSEGLFGPESLTWRINRENVLVLGGGCALMLQVAHPLVAAGVAQHSNYRKDPWGRLFRTLDRTTAIVFGDEDDAEQASLRRLEPARQGGGHQRRRASPTGRATRSC